MTVLVGLGNPGRKYSYTKHNFGFWVVDRFVEKHSLSFQSGRGDYLISKSDGLTCVKPTTFMNSSGVAVAEYCQYFQIDVENLLIIYDDVDLPLGTLRFRPDGGAGGHKGIESVIYQMKSEDFYFQLDKRSFHSFSTVFPYFIHNFGANFSTVFTQLLLLREVSEIISI